MHKWLVLTCNIRPEPSANRVRLWRQLKRIGAILRQENCWVLPSKPRTHEQQRRLATETIEIGGDATLRGGRTLFLEYQKTRQYRNPLNRRTI